MDKVIEAIEALPNYWGRVSRSDVLRILREHVPQLARVVIAEVESVASLPAWRVELAKLQGRWDRPLDEQKHPCELHTYLMALKKLDALRLVIESGKGEAEVPEWVATHMPAQGGGHVPAGSFKHPRA